MQNVTSVTDSYVASAPQTAQATKATQTAAQATSGAAVQAASGEAAVYEKSTEQKPATYSVHKMSPEERANLVQQLKADQESRQQSLMKLVEQMLSGQTKAYGMASGDQSIWKFLSGGNFTVDAATKAQAQADIAEDGYWGVEQTAQRLFDFASALAGDDVDKMKEMQEAMEKGFKQAEKTWGGNLPEISQKTMDTARQKFEDYYASKPQ